MDSPWDDFQRVYFYERGRNSWLAGYRLADNPWPRDTQPNNHDSWAAGWRACEEDWQHAFGRQQETE